MRQLLIITQILSPIVFSSLKFYCPVCLIVNIRCAISICVARESSCPGIYIYIYIFSVKSSQNYNLQLKKKTKYLAFLIFINCSYSYISLFSKPMFFLLVLEILILFCFDYYFFSIISLRIMLT
jgi:hypothetical protein